MSDRFYRVSIDLPDSVATAGTDDTKYTCIGQKGTYKLVYCNLVADEAVTADATDYVTLSIEHDGTDATSDLDTTSTSLVKGAVSAFTLATGEALEVDGLTGSIEVEVVKTGATGIAIIGSVVAVYEKIAD